MRRRNIWSAFAAAWSAVAVLSCTAILGVSDVPDAVTADGSTTDGTVSSGDGSGTDSGPTFDSGLDAGCPTTLADGSYLVHSTLTSGSGPGCPPADYSVTYPTTPDASDSGPNPCTSTADRATCTTMSDCNVVSGGYTTVVHITQTISAGGTSATLTSSSTTTQPDGGVFFACSYTSTYTKQ